METAFSRSLQHVYRLLWQWNFKEDCIIRAFLGLKVAHVTYLR